MIGLILKDLLVNKKYIVLGGIVSIAYIFISIDFVIPYIMLYCVMYNLSTFAYDNQANWDLYALTLPTSRNVQRKIVSNRVMLGNIHDI